MDTNTLDVLISSKRDDLINNTYLDELDFIRTNFIDYDLHLVDSFSWRVLNDYRNTICYGWTSKSQQGKIIELIEKYGSNSSFWEYLGEFKEEREFYKKRLAYLILTIQAFLLENKNQKSTCRILRKFISLGHIIHRRLFMHPLTEKQKAYIFRMERIVGIYYNDLSPEENGETWFERK